jgi:outer membrane biosynthesis protein TonB
MKAASFLAFFLVLLPCFAAGADPRPSGDDELSRRAARLTVLVPPEYPAQALRDRVEATVDVVGTVRGDGSFDVVGIQATPDREDFRSVVSQVAKYWTLRPRYGFDCSPREVEGRLRIWFEIKVGGPAISVSYPDAAAPVTGAVDAPARLSGQSPEHTPAYRANPQYPRDALIRNLQGRVEALMRVGTDGKVERVVIVPDGHPKVFDGAVTPALSSWRFPSRPGGAGLPRCVETVIDFAIGGGPGMPANARETVTVR